MADCSPDEVQRNPGTHQIKPWIRQAASRLRVLENSGGSVGENFVAFIAFVALRPIRSSRCGCPALQNSKATNASQYFSEKSENYLFVPSGEGTNAGKDRFLPLAETTRCFACPYERLPSGAWGSRERVMADRSQDEVQRNPETPHIKPRIPQAASRLRVGNDKQTRSIFAKETESGARLQPAGAAVSPRAPCFIPCQTTADSLLFPRI